VVKSFAISVDFKDYFLIDILKNHFLEKPSRWWSLRLAKSGVPNSFDLAFDDLIYHQQK